MNDNPVIANINDFKVVDSTEEESESCPECRGEEKFVHHQLPPSRFKGRKFLPPKEKT